MIWLDHGTFSLSESFSSVITFCSEMVVAVAVFVTFDFSANCASDSANSRCRLSFSVK